MIDKQKKIEALFYQLDSGKEPVREWLFDLEREDRRIIGKDVLKVELGFPIGMPYCRKLERGLYEVRSDISHGRIARILFCIENKRMILLHGFIKKTQKTPSKDLDIAKKRMKG